MKPAQPKDNRSFPRANILGSGWKRGSDLLLAVIALLVLSPLLLVVALFVRVFLGGPVFFRHVRPGLNEIPFRLYKFRTMTDARDESGHLLPDGQRLTPLGKFLRRCSLDELPELFNVIKGDMSLVGPRPLLLQYLPYFTEKEKLRHSVKPGITGWAQIHGRNFVPWDERLALDVWYVENYSLGLDLLIMFKTVLFVLGGRGVSPDPDLVETNLDDERRNPLRESGA